MPPRLFKYQRASPQAIKNLSDRSLWFSRPRGFNDPFDCASLVSDYTIHPDEWDRILDECCCTAPNPSQLKNELEADHVNAAG
jgi:hypothetical protein